MRKISLLSILVLFLTGESFAQHPYLGIQTSPRKGIISSLMNPAEINNLSRPVEVQFFSANAAVGNNVLSFQDIINTNEGILEMVLNNANGPINGRSNINLILPSVAFKVRDWSFGLSTQILTNADIVDLNPEIARPLIQNEFNSVSNQISLNSPYNQRFNIVGWMEIGMMAGKELINNQYQKLSVGGNLKILFPSTYTNFGLSDLRGTLVQEGFEVSLTDTRGDFNISYTENMVNENEFGLSYNSISIGRPNGLGLDLGINYQQKDEKGTWLNTGLALKNFGGMTFGQEQVNNTYSVNIPEGEFFRLDNLEGNLQDVEDQILASGYFTRESSKEDIRTKLPTMIAFNVDYKIIPQLYVSLYTQTRVGDENDNERILAQNIISITPRLLLGNFEIYSPWANYQISGLTGGLGLRYGGFFVGSQSVITGLLGNTRQADFHMGLSWGFGRY